MTKLTTPDYPESSSPVSALRYTPLFAQVRAMKGRMIPFSGWEMAVQYSGITQEHQAVRSKVGMFDISHMGMFSLQGKELIKTLQTLVPSDLSRLQPHRAQYTVLLNAAGGIIDDIIFYDQGIDSKTGNERGILIVNSATCSADKVWLMTAFEPHQIDLIDLSPERVLIAIQGPQSLSLLQSLVTSDLSSIPIFGHQEINLWENPAFIARTGYTGEDGFEVMVDIETGQKLWQKLFDLGVTPCGLGARDTLRLEAAMCLYGQDITEQTTPLEAGLGWLVHLDSKGDFIGRNVLEKQKKEGVSRRLVGLELTGRHIARHGYAIFREGEQIGEVTSGTFSPTLNKGIALGYVPTAFANLGQVLQIEIRGNFFPATVVKRPFYRSPHRS